MPAPGQWMPDELFLRLVRQGLTFEEIAKENERQTGYRPDRSGVYYHKQRLWQGTGRAYNRVELIPEEWHVKPEHRSSRYCRWLGAESRRRRLASENKRYSRLSLTDQKALALMNRVLFKDDGETLWVIDYNHQKGFHLVRATPDDIDIVRRPKPLPRPEDDNRYPDGKEPPGHEVAPAFKLCVFQPAGPPGHRYGFPGEHALQLCLCPLVLQ